MICLGGKKRYCGENELYEENLVLSESVWRFSVHALNQSVWVNASLDKGLQIDNWFMFTKASNTHT